MGINIKLALVFFMLFSGALFWYVQSNKTRSTTTSEKQDITLFLPEGDVIGKLTWARLKEMANALLPVVSPLDKKTVDLVHTTLVEAGFHSDTIYFSGNSSAFNLAMVGEITNYESALNYLNDLAFFGDWSITDTLDFRNFQLPNMPVEIDLFQDVYRVSWQSSEALETIEGKSVKTRWSRVLPNQFLFEHKFLAAYGISKVIVDMVQNGLMIEAELTEEFPLEANINHFSANLNSCKNAQISVQKKAPLPQGWRLFFSELTIKSSLPIADFYENWNGMFSFAFHDSKTLLEITKSIDFNDDFEEVVIEKKIEKEVNDIVFEIGSDDPKLFINLLESRGILTEVKGDYYLLFSPPLELLIAQNKLLFQTKGSHHFKSDVENSSNRVSWIYATKRFIGNMNFGSGIIRLSLDWMEEVPC